MILHPFCVGESTPKLDFSFSGTRTDVSGDPNADWEFSLLSTGKLLFNKNPGLIDVCIVGPGGAGNGPGGAGGGYVKNLFGVEVQKGVEYDIIIGLGAEVGSSEGGATSAFGETANGGKSSTSSDGADGGNGGGGAAKSGADLKNFYGGDGGTDGSDGTSGRSDDGVTASKPGGVGGSGQDDTTRPFQDPNRDPLAGGGGSWPNGDGGHCGGGAYKTDGAENTGGGGGGDGGKGGHGLVIIRNHREVAA